ncbi:MAG: YebC/PmpR family DNA-binding transcriptional regulator [Candidatus Dojkabacteria bacterium]
MSGHSKWSTIKRKKGANDAQRAKEFTKVARLITVAAQNGGGDPGMNPSLALAIEKARAINMPNDNVDRAIKRGTGEGEKSGRLEELSYEGYGPHGVSIIVDCTTDNRNRTVSELRSSIEKSGGKFAEAGSVSWQFETIGRILLEFETEEEKKAREQVKWNEKDKLAIPKLARDQADEFELELYDISGVREVIQDEEGMEIRTEFAELNNVKKAIEDKNVFITNAEVVKFSTTPVELSEAEQERVDRFIETIEENDDVQKVWVNL